ncbi:MAG: hypothetical protein KGV59_07065 [Tenacibaculum sp.]|nr:hypothetical protein [Tenacibaculum sp.]
MRKIFLLFIMVPLLTFGQQKESKLNKQLGIDATILGAGVFYEYPLSNKILSEISVGIGSSFVYAAPTVGFRLSTYRPYSRVALKWYYNREKRLKKGKSISLNVGNFIGIQNKIMYGYGNNPKHNDLAYMMNEIYWGSQAKLDGKLLLDYHFGLGYFLVNDRGFDGFFPTIGIKLKYIL